MTVRFLLAATTAILLAAAPMQAASDFLLVLEGVPGESVDAKYPGAIEIESFSFGVSNSGTVIVGGGGAGKANFTDISFSKRLDKTSPLLYLNCANGKHLPSATLILRKVGADKPFEYYVVKLTEVMVSSVQTGGAAGGDTPTESFSLSFAKIEFIYTPQRADGGVGTPVRSGWNVAENVAF
jgi:type VI secretion system secreted protein Hcp